MGVSAFIHPLPMGEGRGEGLFLKDLNRQDAKIAAFIARFVVIFEIVVVKNIILYPDLNGMD